MLTDTDRLILDLAASHPKPSRIWDATRLSPTRFWQRVDYLIRTRDAIEHDPMLCRKLRDVADAA